MIRLSTSFFGQLFYLRNGLFFTRGLPYAQEHGSYYEYFTIGSMKHSAFDFKMSPLTRKHSDSKFYFESTLELNGKYWEHYKFETSCHGAKETYDLFELNDGWFERPLTWTDVKPLVSVLTKSEHIVHDSSCFVN
jgi:hypothetical protein